MLIIIEKRKNKIKNCEWYQPLLCNVMWLIKQDLYIWSAS
jgi:hypothetical protein